MISREALRAEVCRLLFGQPVPESELSDDDDLFAAGLDSMAILKLVAWIEQQSGRSIDERELATERFKTIKRLLELASSA